MLDWILTKLSDRLGVAPPSSGEQLSRRILFEQPWPQWLYVFTILGSFGLIVWLYRHEGRASTASKIVLATLRFTLVLLALFMLSEAVLSVQRLGLPNLVILVD
ncbi:MAG: VWA domain-containing protein, partial [Isosphaeraceae bacterium]